MSAADDSVALKHSSGWLTAYQDNDGGPLWQEAPIPVLDHAVPLLKNRGSRVVLDVGCGDGRNLAELGRSGFVSAGLDLSAVALMRAHKTLAAAGVSAFLVPGACEQLPFVDASIDAVTCFDVFGQLEKPETFVSEARRVLVPGGVLLVNAFTTTDSEFGKGDKIGDRSFLYKDTLFRFFERDEFLSLFAGWEILHFENRSWDDPPHGTFRPYPHRHNNWYVAATPDLRV